MRTIGVHLPLAPLDVGDVVERTAWPPHVTLVGNARVADGASDAAAAVLRSFAARTPVLGGVGGDEAWFEPGASVLVDLVESPALHEAHGALLTALERDAEGFALLQPTHAREGWQPHRTVAADARPAYGAELAFTDVLLVEIEPEGLPRCAVILARWPLGGLKGGSETTAADVHAVLDALELRGARAAVIGGWGVDALAGRRTRPHHDVDLLVDVEDLAAAISALADAGYRLAFAWSENRWQRSGARLLPSAFVAVDAVGREVDVHAVRLEAGRPVPVSDSSVVLPVAALEGRGAIAGRAVRCATAEAQLVMHTGYDVPDRQRGDLEHLRRLAGAP